MESETNQFTSALENYVCGNYRSASKILDSLIEKEPSNFAYLTTGASCYIELRNNEKALDLLAKAEKLQPNSFKVNFLTGLALFYSKKYVEAQVAFTSGIQLAGNNWGTKGTNGFLGVCVGDGECNPTSDAQMELNVASAACANSSVVKIKFKACYE